MDKLEFKGTRGEWNTNLFSVFIGQEEKIGENVICRLHLGLENYQKGEQQYNAKLIAAAPNILDALLRMKKSIEEQNLQHYFGHSIQYVNEAIEKALK